MKPVDYKRRPRPVQAPEVLWIKAVSRKFGFLIQQLVSSMKSIFRMLSELNLQLNDI